MQKKRSSQISNHMVYYDDDDDSNRIWKKTRKQEIGKYSFDCKKLFFHQQTNEQKKKMFMSYSCKRCEK